MKEFTNKEECLLWLTQNYRNSQHATDSWLVEWGCFDENSAISASDIKGAFELLKNQDFKDVDSKQKLESDTFNSDEKITFTADRVKVIDTNGDTVEVRAGTTDALEYINTPFNPNSNTENKYIRKLKGIECDVYDVLKAFNVTCPALQHLIKKALCAGLRGHKDKEQDLKDILESAKRAVELNK